MLEIQIFQLLLAAVLTWFAYKVGRAVYHQVIDKKTAVGRRARIFEATCTSCRGINIYFQLSDNQLHNLSKGPSINITPADINPKKMIKCGRCGQWFNVWQ